MFLEIFLQDKVVIMEKGRFVHFLNHFNHTRAFEYGKYVALSESGAIAFNKTFFLMNQY